MIELGSPYLSLWLERVHEVLGPEHVVAGGGLVILHHSVRGEEIVHEVACDRCHHDDGESQLGTRGHVAADTRSLVCVEDCLLKALH